MGNETSQLTGLQVDEKAVEVTDFWTHHSATLNTSDDVTELSVFVGEPLVGGTLWVNQTPLEKASKNLMLHRHPCILKYISSWKKGSKFYLAVDNVRPLSHVLGTQTTQQICIGLHSILTALVFLNDKAYASHNNVCSASVYVSHDGSWKLGGLEYLCRFQDLTADYLAKTRAHRYEKAVDPNEDNLVRNKDINLENGAIDQYAFGVLACEVLRRKGDDEIPSLKSFREYCKNELQLSNIQNRPKLTTVLKHPFFTHDFIMIHSFLNELPLKSDLEKADFFSRLLEKLRKFSETIVAGQLGGLLLSRMVLLDSTAQKEVLPYVLCPKKENGEETSPYLFSINTFKQYLIPKLLQIFRVRDAQIRLLLLSHFKYFVHCFSSEQLQDCILPELLLGIKDTNDHLVATTLRSLADLVPLLGAATVIGGKRAKLFTDGRPIIHTSRKQSRRSSKRHSDLRVPSLPVLREIPSEEVEFASTSSSSNTNNMDLAERIVNLPERPSPDGGEDLVSAAEEIDQSINEDDLDNWSDWDIQDSTMNEESMEHDNSEPNTNLHQNEMENDHAHSFNIEICNISENSNNSNDVIVSTNSFSTSLQENLIFDPMTLDLTQISTPSNQSLDSRNKKNVLPDILELDIKNQKNSSQTSKSEEIDFFQDMEPVIESTTKYLIETDNLINDEKTSKNVLVINNTNFNVNEEIANREDGWGEDLDWDEN